LYFAQVEENDQWRTIIPFTLGTTTGYLKSNGLWTQEAAQAVALSYKTREVVRVVWEDET
jgi:hypothetical protein